MSKEDARRVRHEIFIRSVLLMGSRTGKLAEVVIVSRGAAAPMGRIMSFVDIPTRREVFEEEATLVGHTGGVSCMTLLDDGRVVSGSYDKTLIVWAAGDDGAFAAAQTLSGHTSYVCCVAPLDDGRLVSGSERQDADRVGGGRRRGVRGGADSEWAHQLREVRGAARRRAPRERE